MLLAETDWVAVLGAVGTLAVTVTGGLGVWYLRILKAQQAHERELEKEKAEESRKARKDEATEDRRHRRETNDELKDVIELQRKDRESDRALIHALRNDVNQVQTALMVAQKQLEQSQRNHEKCEQDRQQLERRVAALEGRG
jgi:hypothetical protein